MPKVVLDRGIRWKGYWSCGYNCGGATESLEAFPNQMRIILQDRRVIVKLAMRTEQISSLCLCFEENGLQ